jgi:hypothetical protein
VNRNELEMLWLEARERTRTNDFQPHVLALSRHLSAGLSYLSSVGLGTRTTSTSASTCDGSEPRPDGFIGIPYG